MRVLKNGKRVSNKELSFAVLANEEGHARLGVALAKRFIKKAVQRNQIKRQIREAFRLSQDLPAVDIVVLTRKSTSFEDLKGIRKAAHSLFEQLKQWEK